MKKLVLLFSLILVTSIASAQSKIYFHAEIANRNGDVIYINDRSNKPIKEIRIDDKGVFEASFEVNDGFYFMFDGTEYTQLYLKNGFDLKLKMDAKLFDESITYKGKGEAENNMLAQIEIGILIFSKENFSKNKEEFEIAFDTYKTASLDKLNKGRFDQMFNNEIYTYLTEVFEGLQAAYKNAQLSKELTGKSSKSFEYENHAGGKTKLEDLLGKYVYIDVWATWCGPCRAEIPFLKKVEEKYHGKKIEFVSISIDEEKNHEKWKKFVADKSLGGIQLFADKNWMSDFIISYGINSIPRFILLDPKGNVVSVNAYRPSDEKLVAQLDKLLN